MDRVVKPADKSLSIYLAIFSFDDFEYSQVMTNHNSVIEREAQTLESLISSIPSLFGDAFDQQKLSEITARKLFTPVEDEEISVWFARFITLRSNLWLVVDTALINTGGMNKLSSLRPTDWQYFILGYSAVCSLIRLDRFLLSKVAKESIIQRKLNEASPAHRLERKKYSNIYSEMMLPSNALRIHQAHRVSRKYKNRIAAAVNDSPVESIHADLYRQERYLNLSKRAYLTAWWDHRRHSLKRRGASAKQKSLFTVLEYSGRFVSNLSLPRTKKVTPAVLTQLNQVLQPGDILVTRHRQALTNLFLPGYWPHAALYVGSDFDREHLNIDADKQHLEHWKGDNRTLEALKDGVRFRRLEDTLAVDAFVVLRPKLIEEDIAQGIARVIVHAGKGYNFDFDFFRSDHLVCTEIIYRAYDGLNNFSFPLQERMGRKTLSAEDLLDLALDSDWAEPVAIFGVGKSKKKLLLKDDVIEVLAASYRTPAA